jgi:hypothetical protein
MLRRACYALGDDFGVYLRGVAGNGCASDREENVPRDGAAPKMILLARPRWADATDRTLHCPAEPLSKPLAIPMERMPP